jgi:transcriptional regulator GlxA family with amidase domain
MYRDNAMTPRSPCLSPSEEVLDVGVLVLPGISMMSLATVLDPLRAANRVSDRPRFRWRLASADGRPVTTTCGIAVAVDERFETGVRTQMLVLVAGFDVHRHARRPFMAHIAAAARAADLVLAVEAGSWLLARAGLLDGVRATTHWEDLEDFAARHPRVRVCPDRYVVDGRWVSAGSASPTFDFLLHLIRRRCGQRTALEVASVFGYDESHLASDAQSPQALRLLDEQEPRLVRAIRVMQQCLDAPVPMSEVARRAGTTRRTLEKLFAARIGESPGRYFLELRLATARRLVLDTGLPLAEVALRTGFASASVFSRAFRRRFGAAPSRLRRAA